MSAYAALQSFLETEPGGFLAYTAFVSAMLMVGFFAVAVSFRKRFP